MIIVTVELRSARTRKTTVLGTMTIANDGMGTATRGKYCATVYGKDTRKVLDSCVIRDFPRKKLLAWDLVYRVLRAVRGDRNGDDVTGGQRRVIDSMCAGDPDPVERSPTAAGYVPPLSTVTGASRRR